MSEPMPIDLAQHYQNGIYFAIHDQPFDRLHYATGCLLEGLKILGVPAYCNCPIPEMKVRGFDPLAFDLYVFNLTERSARGPMLPFVEKFHRKEKILLSMADTNSTIFPADDFISLMTHENRFVRFAGNRVPWAFGISNEILEATKNPPPFEQRQFGAIRNFRPSNNQDVRNFMDLSFVECLEKYMPIDRAIGENHFDRLLSKTACLAYGGAVIADMLPNGYYAQNENYKYIRDRSDYKKPLAVLRWDSWRFWESLAAGCLTIHLDFEKYGFLLPEMPSPWKHYIPIDMADPIGSVDRLMDSRSQWAEIAHGGREWAIKNYSPVACALRLLKIADSIGRDQTGDSVH
jgi:hypothetical protein